MIYSTILALSLISFCTCTIIITPENPKNPGIDAGVIFIQGAEIDAKHYMLFCKELQAKFNGKLWFALAEFPLSTPEPILIGKIIDDSFVSLAKAGLKVNKDTPFFFVGHSLGGVMVQDYLFGKLSSLSIKIAGLILEGSYIERKHLDQVQSDTLIPPILALGGSSDGVNRISRMAISRYFDMKNDQNRFLFKRLTLVVDGMNHYQFAGEGNPPKLVRDNDLKPLIDDQSARDQITAIVSSFMSLALNSGTDADKSLIGKYFDSSSRLLDPIIDALEMEGSYHLNPPCYQNETVINCTLGSRWTEMYSQRIMGSPNASLIDVDVFHPVYQVNPVHLPIIFNSCANEPSTCSLNMTTVTQLEYSTGDSLDISLQPSGASEMRTKLASRQSVLHAYTGLTYDLKVTDAGNICADINTQSIDWAMSKTPKDVLERYLSQGRQLTVGADIGPLNVGPLWIWTPLVNSFCKVLLYKHFMNIFYFFKEYNKKDDPNTKKPIVEIRSPMMKTPIDYPVALARGFHYCKVLSPARAIEWIYTDSLKP